MKIKRWEWKVSHCTLWGCSWILADVKHPPIYWGFDGIKSIKAQKTDLQQVQQINKIFFYMQIFKIWFFSSDFWFLIFSDFWRIQNILYFLFLSVSLFLFSSLFLCSFSNPFQSIKTITFYPAIIASVPAGIYSPSDFAAVPMVKQSRRSILYIYITLCTIQPLYYTLSIMHF